MNSDTHSVFLNSIRYSIGAKLAAVVVAMSYQVSQGKRQLTHLIPIRDDIRLPHRQRATELVELQV